jgi:Glycosyltransferase family 17
MLIDCFPAFQETDLAEFRVRYLSKFVDYVVIAESDLTHSGYEKPLYFTEWLNSKPIFKDKVEILHINLNLNSTAWEREIATRETLIRYAAMKYPKAQFILSDLDEIPSREQVKRFLELSGSYHFSTPTTYRYANWHLVDEHATWKLGVMGNSEISERKNGGRLDKLPTLDALDCGLHFSYLNHDSIGMEKKLRSFAHQELAFPEMYSSNLLQFSNAYQIDHLGRFNRKGNGLLNVRRKETLSEIQIEAFKFQQSWFNFETITLRTYARKFASLVVTAISRNRVSSIIIYRHFVLRSERRRTQIFLAYLYLTSTLYRCTSMRIKHELKKKYRNIATKYEQHRYLNNEQTT